MKSISFILAFLFPLFLFAEENEIVDCVKYAMITNGKIQTLKGVIVATDGGTVVPTDNGKHYWKLAEDDSVNFAFEYPQGDNVLNVKIFLLSYGNGNIRIRCNGKTILDKLPLSAKNSKTELKLENPSPQNQLRIIALSETGIQGLRIEWQEKETLEEKILEFIELKGHTARVNSAVFSPDGKVVVTASGDDTARIGDAATGKELKILEGHTNSVEETIPAQPTDSTEEISINNSVEETIPAQSTSSTTELPTNRTNIDWRTPKAVLEAEAARDNPAALYFLARCYKHGTNDCKIDNNKSSELYQRGSKLADGGNPYAQCCRGACYLRGYGVEQDSKEAVKWYRKAAEQNYAEAQFNLGRCYYYGDGVEQDSKEAIKWWRKAAEQGYELRTR
ncbi:MAG: hypothetical protein LBC74_04410 [Planctomycetaceae bacterium]|jgi:hypothetical protein|nr:hypothetical protein [Planctomycetaceae bacterium]